MHASHTKITTVREFTMPGNALDLRTLLGVTICGNTVTTQCFAFPQKITEKLCVMLPPMPKAGKDETTIKSIQCKSGLIIVEIAGQLDLAIKQVIGALVRRLVATNVSSLFLPGGRDGERTRYYYGFNANVLTEVPGQALSNVRILDDRNALIFAQMNELKFLSTTRVGGSWVREASSLYGFKKEIIFLGRAQNDTVAVTLAGEALTLSARFSTTDVMCSVFTGFQPAQMTAVFGSIQQIGACACAGMKGQEMIVIPIMPSKE